MEEYGAESEYSLQHFGFTPTQFFQEFSDTVINHMCELIKTCIAEISAKEDLRDRESLIENVQEVHGRWCESAKTVLASLEPLIVKYFTIPKNIVLPCDIKKDSKCTEEDVKNEEAKISGLENVYKKELQKMESLKAEIAYLEQLEVVQQEVEQELLKIKQLEQTAADIKEMETLEKVYKEHLQLFLSGDSEKLNAELDIEQNQFVSE